MESPISLSGIGLLFFTSSFSKINNNHAYKIKMCMTSTWQKVYIDNVVMSVNKRENCHQLL